MDVSGGFDAGLNADHQLVTSGAYRFVRHPIYAATLSSHLIGSLAGIHVS